MQFSETTLDLFFRFERLSNLYTYLSNRYFTARQVVYRNAFTLAFLANTLSFPLIARRHERKRVKRRKRRKEARNDENRSIITETKGFNSLQSHSNVVSNGLKYS